MNEEFEQLEEFEELRELNPEHSLMELFEKLTFFERIDKIKFGLTQPKETGDYKWAKFELKRFMSPVAGVIVPMIILLLLVTFAKFGAGTDREYEVQIVDPEETPDLEKIEEIIEEPPEPPEPVEMDFTQEPVLTDTPTPTPPTDFSPQPAEFDSVAIVKSPVIMRGIYGSRSPGNRGSALARFGGMGTEGAVLRALRWLKTEQNDDGSWDKNKPAMTALAILTYLAHGDTPASEEFGYTVEKALKYLVDNQKGNGRFNGADGHDYTQPIAAYALAEAYGLTRVPHLKYAAEKAIAEIIKGQNASGGFNYNLKPATRDDTSYMAWCVQALKAAKMAHLDNDGLDACMTRAIGGFKKNYGGGDGYGGFGYTGPGGGGKGLTGAGVLCLQFLGASNSRECTGGLAGLEKSKFSWDNIESGWAKSPLYYWYYTTQAKFHHGGATWNNWNAQFSGTLVKEQDIIKKEQSGYTDHLGNAHDIGYWDSPAAAEHTGGNGRVMDTMLCTLMLEVYYRYLPTFQTPKAEEQAAIEEDDDNVDIDIDI